MYIFTSRNRIALLQKEEERARKKIEKTKSRAIEILALREENERRIKEWLAATNDDEEIQRQKAQKSKEFDDKNRKYRADRMKKLRDHQMEGVIKLKEQKKTILKEIITFESTEMRKNQQRREDVRRKEEEARLKKEIDLAEKEKKAREYYERKAANEAAEAKRAEKLVRALEKKEKVMDLSQKYSPVYLFSFFIIFRSGLKSSRRPR